MIFIVHGPFMDDFFMISFRWGIVGEMWYDHGMGQAAGEP